jgi:hypothetical protein
MPTIGSQALLRVLPSTHYDFRPLIGAKIEIPIAQHIDVLGFEHAALQVRVRSGSFPPGSLMRLSLADDGFDPADPGTSFLSKTIGGEPIGVLEITEKTVFPFYQSVATAVPGRFGRLMVVTAAFTGGPDGGPSVTMSLDLVLSGGSVGTTIHQPLTYLGYTHELVETEEPFEHLTFDKPQHSPVFEPGLVNRLVASIRDLFQTARLPPGYPRFGNVNVAIQRPPEGFEERRSQP